MSHWERKMKTYFKRIDFDKDGSITRKDFEGMAERFIATPDFNKDHADDLKKTLTAVWDKYLQGVGGGEGISQDAFIESMKKQVHDPNLKKTLEGPLPLFFHAVDLNSDGLISGQEYKNFFGILGLDTALADPAFKAIDTNNDGDISLDEFTAAGSDFFIVEKEGHPSDCFWGPLE